MVSLTAFLGGRLKLAFALAAVMGKPTWVDLGGNMHLGKLGKLGKARNLPKITSKTLSRFSNQKCMNSV